MLAGQGVVSLVVVKAAGRRKSVRVVALGTVAGERLLVVVFVTAEALLPQAQLGLLVGFQLGICYEIGLVAIPTLDFFMGSRQIIPGEGMVEVLLLKAHHVEVASVVVAVTGGAVFSAHLLGGVIALPGIHPGLDLLVAGQAFVIGDSASQHMALGAVAHPFQLGMGLGQVSRRELGHDIACQKQKTY